MWRVCEKHFSNSFIIHAALNQPEHPLALVFEILREKQKPCEIKVGNITTEIHMYVKFSECTWKLPWNFCYACEIFFTHVKQFFLVCEILLRIEYFFTCMKQCCSVCEIFHTCETILSCMWNCFAHVKQSCYACEIFSMHMN